MAGVWCDGRLPSKESLGCRRAGKTAGVSGGLPSRTFTVAKINGVQVAGRAGKVACSGGAPSVDALRLHLCPHAASASARGAVLCRDDPAGLKSPTSPGALERKRCLGRRWLDLRESGTQVGGDDLTHPGARPGASCPLDPPARTHPQLRGRFFQALLCGWQASGSAAGCVVGVSLAHARPGFHMWMLQAQVCPRGSYGL